MKNKIDFICLLPGVEQTMPIVEASKHKPSWIKKAAADFKKLGSITQQYRGGQEMYGDPNMMKFKIVFNFFIIKIYFSSIIL